MRERSRDEALMPDGIYGVHLYNMIRTKRSWFTAYFHLGYLREGRGRLTNAPKTSNCFHC